MEFEFLDPLDYSTGPHALIRITPGDDQFPETLCCTDFADNACDEPDAGCCFPRDLVVAVDPRELLELIGPITANIPDCLLGDNELCLECEETLNDPVLCGVP